jgi:DNA-binding response OmpR family regulator
VHALVIEDHPDIAALIADELRELGYETFDIVDREHKAVEAAKERCPDLITADDKLTTGSGVTAVQAICEHQVIPVVFIVGAPEGIEPPVPFAAVVAKPFGGSTLRRAIGEAIVSAQRHLGLERKTNNGLPIR